MSSSFSRIVRIIFDCIINFCVCLLYGIRGKAATRDVLQLNFESFFVRLSAKSRVRITTNDEIIRGEIAIKAHLFPLGSFFFLSHSVLSAVELRSSSGKQRSTLCKIDVELFL